MTFNIGERLRKEREKKGYSLEEVHARLRIHPSVLSHLETNQFDALPAAIYTKGFLKRYSEFLEVNAQEMLSEFDALKITEKNQSFAVGLQQPPKKKTPKESDTPPMIRVSDAVNWFRMHQKRIFSVGLVFAVFFSLLALFDKFMAPRESSNRLELKSPVGKDLSNPNDRGRGPRQNYINTTAMNNFPELKVKDPLRLEIKAHTNAWVRISADGRVVLETILKPGQTKYIDARNDLELKLGRPAGISIGINGYSLGSPGEGQATHVLINHSGMIQLR